MSFSPESWTVSSNDVFKISITDSSGSFTFKPLFTYPIFGDAEQIFGYSKDLEINLVFDSVTFLPLLNIKYSKKLNDDVDDIEAKLLEFLPASTVVNDEEKWSRQVKSELASITTKIATNYSKIASYQSKNNTFNIFKTKFDNDFSVELNKRLQIFVLLYIEAGSFIDASDPLWDIFIVLSSTTNEIVGFTTTYSYFKYNGALEFDKEDGIKTRNKISQFVILPHKQHAKHGSNLYNLVYDYWIKDSKVEEVTIEDPNEAFDDLRYLNDFKRLFENGDLNDLPNDIKVLDQSWFEEHRKKTKIELNQFKKIIEIGYLYQGKNLKLLRLLVKKRLYEKNKDGLLELEISVRNDKLQTAYERIKQDYLRLIDSLRLREADTERLAKKPKI